MSHVVDFHTHTFHSDGKGLPADLVAAAKQTNPAVTQLGISDHNTFSGAESFLAACDQSDIEGFILSEVGGCHDKLPSAGEIHFLLCFGGKWTDDVARRCDMFTPYFNKLFETDTKNIYIFLEAAATLGVYISIREVVQRAVEFYHDLPEPRDPAIIGSPAFRDVRKILASRGLNKPGPRVVGRTEYERQVWAKTGVKPLPTPNISEAYDICHKAKPAVILAHPMHIGLTPQELRPFIEEWKAEMGLVALEAHYAGQFYGEWKVLADEMGLLVSAGSDTHSLYDGVKGYGALPVVEPEEADIPALLEVLRAAGNS
ncbi:MAG: hypothetical protein J7M14_02745 [Planctomycetes bacterium]|nr:hypothetical protein [Planctomycetota bacterium]